VLALFVYILSEFFRDLCPGKRTQGNQVICFLALGRVCKALCAILFGKKLKVLILKKIKFGRKLFI
jgi:hypothetical protein